MHKPTTQILKVTEKSFAKLGILFYANLSVKCVSTADPFYYRFGIEIIFYWNRIYVASFSNQTKTLSLKIEMNTFSNRGHIYGHFEKKKIQISRKLTKWWGK